MKHNLPPRNVLNCLRKFIVTKQFTATKYIKRIVKTLCDAGIQLTLYAS